MCVCVCARVAQDFPLPPNVRATTKAAEAIHGAQFAVHAVPVQSSRAFLVAIRDLLPPLVPIVCLSKGLEVRSLLCILYCTRNSYHSAVPSYSA